MVATPIGDRAIHQLKVGDFVWSKPEAGGAPFAAKILATHLRTDQPIYRLKLESTDADGLTKRDTLLVTPGHPFYVPALHGFVPAIKLEAGDKLQSLGDGSGDDASISVDFIELFRTQGKTYNLTVDVGHTFYVGTLKTWVHNLGLCADCNNGVCKLQEKADASADIKGNSLTGEIADNLSNAERRWILRINQGSFHWRAERYRSMAVEKAVHSLTPKVVHPKSILKVKK